MGSTEESARLVHAAGASAGTATATVTSAGATNVAGAAQRDATCVPNIGPRQRRRRFSTAIVLGVLSLILGGAVDLLAAPRPLRLIVFLPLFGSAVGYFQWRDHT